MPLAQAARLVRRGPILALLALTALASGTAALTLNVEGPSTPLEPAIEFGDLLVAAEVDCQAVWARRSPAQEPTLLLNVSSADGVVATGAQEHALPEGGCPFPSGTTTVDAAFQLLVPREAPGLVPLNVSVTGTLQGEPLPGFGGPEQATAELQVQGAPYFLLEATADRKLVCACPDAHFNLTLTNFGNVPVLVTLQAQPGDGVEVLPIAPVIVQSPNHATDFTVVTVPIVARLAAGQGEGAFSVAIHQAASMDPQTYKAGFPLQANFLAVAPAKQGPLPTPGLVAPLVLVGLALAAWAARRP